MATNYPGSLDTATQQPSPSSTTDLDATGYEHDVVHTNHSGALIALEAYKKAIKKRKIQFTVRQIMWNKYSKFSKKIRSVEDVYVKRKYKGDIKRFRHEVLNAPTSYVTTLCISVIA